VTLQVNGISLSSSSNVGEITVGRGKLFMRHRAVQNTSTFGREQ
jgi:hypothetical protein